MTDKQYVPDENGRVDGARMFRDERLVIDVDSETPAKELEDAFCNWLRFRREALTEDDIKDIAEFTLPTLRNQAGIEYASEPNPLYRGVRLNDLVNQDVEL